MCLIAAVMLAAVRTMHMATTVIGYRRGTSPDFHTKESGKVSVVEVEASSRLTPHHVSLLDVSGTTEVASHKLRSVVPGFVPGV